MTGKTDSIVTQMNIRNNVREMQESFKDLYSWRDEMNQKEEELKKRASGSKSAARTPAVRGKAAPVTAPGESSLHAPAPSLTPGALPRMNTSSGRVCGRSTCEANERACAANVISQPFP